MSGIPLRRVFIAALLAMFILNSLTVRAAHIEPPQQYFTNLASRLLQQQLGLWPTNVQIAPTNQYDSSVHRIFQVAANICEAMNTNSYPLVFRALFATNEGGVFLSGFKCDNRADTIGEWIGSNPYGVPLVIGARKGFPTFNEFTLRSDTLVARTLQLTRPTVNSLPTRTNQMYVLGFTNQLFVESWNSYHESFGAPSKILISNRLTMTITNAAGVLYEGSFVSGTETNIDAWPGTLDLSMSRGFKLPFSTNHPVLHNGVLRFVGNIFDTNSLDFEVLPDFPLPDWTLCVSNHLVYLHSVGTNLTDCVIVDDMSAQNLTSWLPNAPSPQSLIGSVWNTNRNRGPGGPTEGIRAQIVFNMLAPASSDDWRPYSVVAVDVRKAVANFNEFLLGKTNAGLVIETPFNPVARLARIKTYEVNDPFVRTHPSDVNGTAELSRILTRVADVYASDNPSSLTNYNKSYSPWHSMSFSESDPTVCDPGRSSSDDWTFPTNESPRVEWLGRVHRGTPWQSIYLKSQAASTAAWGSRHRHPLSHPTNDWPLALLLAAEWIADTSPARISINSTNLGEWTAVLAGLTVLSNITSYEFPPIPAIQSIIITPDDTRIETLLAGMNRFRGMQPNHYFRDVTGWLQTPELSFASPWIDQSVQATLYGNTDEVFESLPSQLLSRVRQDPVAALQSVSSGMTLSFTGCIEAQYRLQVSSDLTSWTTLPGHYVPTNGAFQAPVEPGSGSQFFRAVAE